MIEFAEAAAEYFGRVEQHIYKGNEIRADSWMSIDEKQEELKQLDRKRTQAHDRLIRMYCQNFDFSNIENRTQLADKVAMMIFRGLDIEIGDNMKEGDIRDALAEHLHENKITKEQIITILNRPHKIERSVNI